MPIEQEHGAFLPTENMMQSQQASPAYAHDKLGVPFVEQLWRAVVNNRWLLLTIIGICVVLGIIITLLTTPLYTASSLIEISRQQGNVTGVETVQQEDRSHDQEFYDTQYTLLEARSLAERVVREENLIATDEFFELVGVATQNEGLATGDGQNVLGNRGRSERFDLAVKVLSENISIVPVRGSSLIEVRFTSPDPELSARIANSWVDQFTDASLDRRFASTQDAREFLEAQLEELRERLEESETRLVNYASDNQIVALSQRQDAEGGTVNAQTLVAANLEAMNAELGRARSDRIAAQSSLQRGNGAREALTNPAVNNLRKSRAEVAGERAKLLAIFEPEYPAVVALTSQLEDLGRSIAQEEARIRSAGRNAYNEALQRENELASQVSGLTDRFAGQNKDSIQYNIYQREVDTSRELYKGLLQRYKEIGVAGVGANNIAIVDQAVVPSDPSSPNLLLNLALAIIAGVALSVGFIFAREQIDQTLRDPSDVSKLLGLTVLGTAPDSHGDVGEALSDPKSILSEAYFSVGTNLSFATEHGVPRSFALTSTQPNEGKSTSVYGLALVLARTGKRTIIVDADMRNPSAHNFFDMDNTKGLSNYLSGDDDLATMIESTDSQKLSVMSAGAIPPNAAELLSGDRLSVLIERLLIDYDHVLFDAPPVLGLADVPLLAKHVEGMIYTIEANRAKLRTIQSALQRLRTSKTRILGAIVTKIDARNSAYGYGYGYGYGYSYSSSKEAGAK